MRPSRAAILLLSLLAVPPSCPAQSACELTAKIREVITGPDYKHSHWGLLVADAVTGKPLFEQDADKLFAPASTTKLFSCAAALCEFGPGYRFETPIYCRGPIAKGILHGDLILVASGDLTLGGRTDKQGRIAFKDHDHTYAAGGTKTELTATDPQAGLVALARQVKESGIRKVTGDVLIDTRLFEPALGTGSGPSRLSPILVNDNVIDFLVTPGMRHGDPATVKVRPETSFFQVDARAETVDADETSLSVRAVGPGRLTVRGKIALKSKPVVVIHAIEDARVFARAVLIEALRKEGVDIDASPLAEPRGELPNGEDCAKLHRAALLVSPPLSESLKVTLKVSHNLYASTLPLLIAAKHGQRTLSEGMKLQRKRLAELGVDTEAVSFGGGAGGDPADRTTPRAAGQLLLAMRKRPEYAAYLAALPVLGVDGTLADVVDAKSPARGKVFAKTGTLGSADRLNGRTLLRSKALAGYMTAARGRELVFAMFVNDVPLPAKETPAREGKVLGKLCEIIYQHTP
jgi:D-alanyl-D-alanine carboxypeptidase/D-alanyl-D-alanine-endopeptidase (penicillin-binding protein 4)